jgi:transposase/IS5 family transposase
MLIPEDNTLRKMNVEIDFTFIIDEVRGSYSEMLGRPAEDIVMMFKLLILKARDKISDRGLVRRLNTDLEYKFFLGLEPEDMNVIHPSLLSKFRRLRFNQESAASLAQAAVDRTVDLAVEKGIVKRRSMLITDSTHTLSIYGSISPREALIKAGKETRKAIYKIDPSAKERMPKKRESSRLLDEQIAYTKELLAVANAEPAAMLARESIDSLAELLDDVEEQIEFSKDADARTGHKTADTSFFGYKSHLCMTEERIIASVVVTGGEASDSKQLEGLVASAEHAGIEVDAVIGDAAYSGKANIEFCEGHKDTSGNDSPIKLSSKVSESVSHGRRKVEWDFNKDAGMYVCPAGHMATRKTRQGPRSASSGYRSIVYHFDVERCRKCPLRDGCYKDGSKTKTYYVTIHAEEHTRHMARMESDEYKELYSHRYKIEAKNAELKANYGYGRATQVGLSGMYLQAAATILLANVRRIETIEKERCSREQSAKKQKIAKN